MQFAISTLVGIICAAVVLPPINRASAAEGAVADAVVAESTVVESKMPARPVEVSISAEPYMVGGLFVTPFLPRQGEAMTITVRATLNAPTDGPIPAQLEVRDRQGNALASARLNLTVKAITVESEKKAASAFVAEAQWTWTSGANGLFTVRATIDPDNKLTPRDNGRKQATIELAVIAPGRQLYFPWYVENDRPIRWGNVVTSAQSKQQRLRLAERGVTPLAWQYGGLSWPNHDAVRREKGEEEALRQIEGHFREVYASTPGDAQGYGIDEIGGYPESWAEKKSAATMRALKWAKQQRPDLFFAVWHCGGTRDAFAKYFRDAADLVMLEIYIWDALPKQLKTEDIYQVIRNRVEPYYRINDMMVPTYGSHCHTVVALDIAEAVDVTNFGELEQVVRFIRQEFPELPGQGWYSGSLLKNAQGRLDEARHQQIVRLASDLNLKYFIKPCVTFLQQSLWLDEYRDGKATLTAAVSNIGAMDAGPLSVELFCDGASLGKVKAERVPAGSHRNNDRAHLTLTAPLPPGTHAFEARIAETDGFATILNPVVRLSRFLE